MNLNQILNMVTRLFVRKGVNWGVNKGTKAIAKRSAAKPVVTDHTNHARDVAKRARQAAKVTRRIGR